VVRRNVENAVTIPAFHKKYKYLARSASPSSTKRQSTSKHFGSFRITLRVLYNINDMDSDRVYIQVGDHVHYWRDEKLFIFDDTLQHQSVNESEDLRFCMFVDILRPTLFPRLLSGLNDRRPHATRRPVQPRLRQELGHAQVRLIDEPKTRRCETVHDTGSVGRVS